jgi:peroxiredoxin
VTQPVLKGGDPSPHFSLPCVDGKTYNLHSFAEKPVLVVLFSCNHCPYVQAYEGRLIEIQRDYGDRGVQLVAINSNDDVDYPEDSFENMVTRAKAKGYNFPYLRDASQQVARAYGATHTPHLFVFDRHRRLRYTGKIDDNWQRPDAVTRRYLREALEAILRDSEPTEPATHAIGCTIKWAH